MAMSALMSFDFSDEFLSTLRQIKEIPVHFYNREGQILIYKKAHVTDEEIDRLTRFRKSGIYYKSEDTSTLESALDLQLVEKLIPEGLTDTKLISEKYTDVLAEETESLFQQIMRQSLRSEHVMNMSGNLKTLFSDFAGQEDAMTGLVNILELMKSRDNPFDVEMAVKRSVVSMALKTRGMHAADKFKDSPAVRENVSALMMSSILCDIGCFKMEMPKNAGLSLKQMTYIKKHPFLSYLMIAHEPAIDSKIKHDVLTHHRPLPFDRNDNNYPNLRALTNRLVELERECGRQSGKKLIAEDIRKQLEFFRENRTYREAVNILSIASEFASLTSDVPWRKSLPAAQAVKCIINNSYFTHTPRIMQDFLDYVAISLCDNEKILDEGDFIVVANESHDGSAIFEVCQIESIGRFQSRPGVRRIASVRPLCTNVPKLAIKGFDAKSLRIDPRTAHFELMKDDTRRIIYVIDPQDKKEFHSLLSIATRKIFSTPPPDNH